MKPGTLRIAAVIILALGAFLFYRYRQPRFVAGEQTPEFTVTLANGAMLKSADLRGKYVLIQFWGSWCGPCRAENPYLAALYRKYRNQGFEILSIGIEQSRLAWNRAIENDGMLWNYHTAEFGQFNGSMAKLFNIHSIPATFLVNPAGVIMGVNLPPEQMDKMLSIALASR